MADGSPVMEATLSYLAFVLVAVALPGVAIQRLLRLRIDAALIAPLGLVLCAAAYGVSLGLDRAALFPALVLLLDLGLLLPSRAAFGLAAGPRVRGALVPFAILVALFAVTQYPYNRVLSDGDFLLDFGEAPDTAFYVGVAWELAAGYPPQAPALAGIPMGYHLGPHLVRGAAARWARTHPYDAISRFDNTLLALALILALRGVAALIGASPGAVALVSWAPLATDFSFLYASIPGARWWSFLCGSNLLHSLFFARSTIFALAIALGALVAYGRFRAGEGRGFLALAGLLSLALPLFNIFLASLMLAGLSLAWLTCPERRPLLALLVPMTLVTGILLLGARTGDALVYLDPLGAVQNTRRLLALPPLSGIALLGGTLLWLVAALGLRLLGLPAAVKALASRQAPAVALASMALLGWPLRLLVHINADGRFDESAYFAEHSGALLWLFTALALAPALVWLRPLALRLALVAILTLPSSVEFVVRKRELTPELIPARALRAMTALAGASQPGSVVLVRPSPRYPPLPMALIGRRVFYSEYIRCLLQFAPREELQRRREIQRRFFRSADAQEALALARQMGAEYLYLPRGETIAFDSRILERIHDQEGERVYRFVKSGG